MWRLFIRVAVCIVLGAATSVAVAWVFAAIPSFRPLGSPVTRGPQSFVWMKSGDEMYVMSAERTAAGTSRCMVQRITDNPFAVAQVPERWPQGPRPRHGRLPVTGASGESVTTTACGWPLRVLKCEALLTSSATAPVRVGAVRFNVAGVPRPLTLPLLPIWPGLAANTALYASLWAAILSAPAPLRRHLRRRRGRCPRCGYDLRADFAAGCPECGWNRAANSARAGPVDTLPHWRGS